MLEPEDSYRYAPDPVAGIPALGWVSRYWDGADVCRSVIHEYLDVVMGADIIARGATPVVRYIEGDFDTVVGEILFELEMDDTDRDLVALALREDVFDLTLILCWPWHLYQITMLTLMALRQPKLPDDYTGPRGYTFRSRREDQFGIAFAVPPGGRIPAPNLPIPRSRTVYWKDPDTNHYTYSYRLSDLRRLFEKDYDLFRGRKAKAAIRDTEG